MHRFRDRTDAGRRLARKLRELSLERPVVLALPRGGVPLGYEVARALTAPLDIWVVRKVGVPWEPEVGLGAVAEGGYVYLNDRVLDQVGLAREDVADIVRAKQLEVDERVRLLRSGRPSPSLRDRTVLVVDDGMATGGSARAAIRSIRAQSPKAIIFAVPVASPDAVAAVAPEVEGLVCLATPEHLVAVGHWYDDFAQVLDEEVIRTLERARQEQVGHEEAVDVA